MSTRLPDRLRTCPKSVLASGILFVGTGLLDLYWGLAPVLGNMARWKGDDLEMVGIAVAALVGGLWTLRGCNWARWLLAVWMVLHIVLSASRPLTIAFHVAIFILVMAALFNPGASRYFRNRKAEGDRAVG